jgi:hypothetical protein
LKPHPNPNSESTFLLKLKLKPCCFPNKSEFSRCILNLRSLKVQKPSLIFWVVTIQLKAKVYEIKCDGVG